jgi:hypothetical protein
MPFKKCVDSLTEICIHFILVNQDFFLKRFTTEELENGVDYLDSDKAAVVNPFDELRKLKQFYDKYKSVDFYNCINH